MLVIQKIVTKRILLEEIFNSISHGIGSLLSIAAIVSLLFLPKKSAVTTLQLILFAAILLIAYTISTLYHSLTFTKARKVFLILDHASIFLLIAATYTALITQVVNNAFSFVLLAVVWGGSIWGIIQKSIWVNKWQKITLALYLGLGWIGILLAKPLMQVLSKPSLVLLVVGGLFYTSGLIFYLWKKLPFSHMIWHFFVLIGSICHFMAIYLV